MRRLLLALVIVLSAASAALANPLDAISHRDKIYDIAIQGDRMLVVGYPGLLLRSTDRGKSFTALEPGTDDALFAVDVNARGRAIAVGRTGLVLVSENRGESWKQYASGTEEHLFDVALTDGGNAWAVGHFGTIIHSSDGGKSWEAQTYDAAFPPLPESGEEDGEATEQAIGAAEEENEGAAEEARLNAVTFADEKRGWIAGEFGLVLHTEDSGKSWKRQRSSSFKLLFAIRAIDSLNVVASGAEGTFIETRDAGATWKSVPTGVTEHLMDLCPAGDALYLVGRDGVVLVREAPAGSVERLSSGIYAWLGSVLFHDARRGFVAGGRGYLLRTDDGGKSWKRLSGR
jgi:photosystem II stability/assembly factor-like uncharacterized protein